MSRHSARGSRWRAVAALVLDRDGHECVACGATADLTVDHIKPVSLHDDADRASDRHLDPDDLITLCRSCNARKGARSGIRLRWFNRRFFPDGAPGTPKCPEFSHDPAQENPDLPLFVPERQENAHATA